MKQILILAALVIGSSAQADIITCSFTEPFVTYQYTTGTRQLSVSNFDQAPVVQQKVGFLIKGPGQFELTKGGKVIMALNLNNQGSDGMSDFVYPYEATVPAMVGMANGGVGGCESLALKKTGGN